MKRGESKTRDEWSTEILDKYTDEEWRLANEYKIVNKRSLTVSFKQNEVQRRINADKSNRKLILKARQFGVSTNGILNIFDKACFNRNVTACILAHEKDAIEKLFRIVTRAYARMVPIVKPELAKGGGSRFELFFPKINSRIYCDLESRGDTINYLHVSEAAFFKNPGKLMSTIQAVPAEGEIQIESTPNGVGNHFYDWWTDETLPYTKMFFPWFLHEEYNMDATSVAEYTGEEIELITKAKTYNVDISPAQIAFRRFKQSELRAMFIQEYPEDDASCFLASGSAALDLIKVSAKLSALNGVKPTTTNGIEIYKPYDKVSTYVIGCDVSEGVGKDYSVATVYKARTREQVAVLRCQAKPYEFAHKIKELASLYTTGGREHPLVAVERNNHGHAVLLELVEHIGYSNIYRAKDDRNGWLTDRITRPLMIDAFIDGIENNNIIINHVQTLKECLTLVDNDGKIEAANGKNDDCVIASAIALQMCLATGYLAVYDNIQDKIRV